MMRTLFLIALIVFTISACTNSNQNGLTTNNNSTPVPRDKADTSLQVSQYIRCIFHDSKGNLWLGTTSDGVCRYDGTSLKYFSTKEGFGGNNVRAIVEDKEGNTWFGTGDGLTEYDGTKFTNFTRKEGLIDNDVWSLLIDRSGAIWIGTLEGVCHYDQEKKFIPFPIPAAVEIDYSRGFSKPKAVWSIVEDNAGNIWFGTNGGGAYRYDPAEANSLTNFSEKDGLTNNFVNQILEDKAGNIWFATHHNGVSCYNPSTRSFTNFTDKEGLCGNQVWTMYEDKTGKLWFAASRGASRFDPAAKSFTTFTSKNGLPDASIFSIYEDRMGNFWFGSGAGLYRFDGTSFMNITKANGPWH
jgi:ligand-binding sensor domain-containing protein